MVEVIRVVEVVRVVEVIRMVEMIRVVYRYEENLGVKGPRKKKNNNNVGLRMTMPQAAGNNPKLT